MNLETNFGGPRPKLWLCFALVSISCINIQGQPAEVKHPGWDIINLRPTDFEPMVTGMDFLSNGDMVICHWGGLHDNLDKPQLTGAVYILKNTSGNTPTPTVITLIDKLEDPVGLTVVNDKIYVSGGNSLLELVDDNHDGKLDSPPRKVFTLPGVHDRHEFLFGVLYRNNKFYVNASSAKTVGDVQTNPNRGTTLEIDPATGKFTVFAMGLREPNGIGMGPEGEIFSPDVQGNWLPANKLNNIRKGRFYGFHHTPAETWDTMEEARPVVYLPQGDVARALGNPLYVEKGQYAGQFLIGDVVAGGIRRIFIEKISGEYQGVVFNFGLGLEAGVERLAWGPDGMLYVGNCGQGAGWSYRKDFGLQKLKLNGQTIFEMLAVRSRPSGMEIEFTEPVGAAASLVASYNVRTWWYNPTAEYGGPPMDTKTLVVKSVSVSPDGKKIFLEIPSLEAKRVVDLKMSFTSAANRPLWTTEAWYTLNSFGTGKPFDPPPQVFTKKNLAHNWPAPFTINNDLNAISIQVNSVGPYSIKAFDLQGQLLASLSGSGESHNSISTKGWQSRICVLKITSDGKFYHRLIPLP
jgi:hypothetical protein